MQVFDIFTYNLNNIRFKDTKDYFDGLLKSSGLSYTDIMFRFWGDSSGNICQKVAKSFPQLSQYIKYIKESEYYLNSAPDNCFTSLNMNNGQIEKYIKAEHKEIFGSLLKKIPNPINFPFMEVVLDNLNWYEDKIQNPVLNSDNINFYGRQFITYFSNSIRFFKEFDYGNKLNLINIFIERKINKDGLEEYPSYFNGLIKKLGKPMHFNRECVFTDDENKNLSNSSIKFQKIIEKSRNKSIDLSENIQQTVDKDYLINSVTPLSGFSPKSIFNKIAKVKKYKYSSCKNGCYTFKNLNGNNHLFKAELMNIPFSSFFDATVSVEGYNFTHTIKYFEQQALTTAAEAEKFAKSVFDAADKSECEFSDDLLSLYGKTPGWYLN